jgi:hypothetical protein
MGSKTQNGDRLENGCQIFLSNFSNLWRRKLHWKVTVHALEARMRNVKTGYTGRTDFIFVRYSTTKSGLPSNNRFRFQGNADKVKPMYNVFPPILFMIYFNDNVSSSDRKASKDRTWKVAVVTYFTVLSWYFLEETGEKYRERTRSE